MPVQARGGAAARPKLPCAEDPELFFPTSYRIKETAEAKRLCRGCPDRIRCATQVAAHGQAEGVYAAMTPKERGGLAALVAAAGGDVSRVLRWFDDREALATAHRMRNNGVARDVAERIVGLADLERARLVRRYTPQLVEQVRSGAVTLREAAVRASAVADWAVKGVAA
jgi:WhiB family redox-sensing transcriptional regulator